MSELKKTWNQPQITALVHDVINQESLLSNCKNTTVKVGGSPEQADSGCLQSSQVGCLACSMLANY